MVPLESILVNDEGWFRLAALLFFLAFMPVGLFYRIRSHTGERLDRWQEGAFGLFGLRLTALAMLVVTLTWMIVPRWATWSQVPTPDWVRWTGLVVAAHGAGLWVWAVHNLGKNLTDTVVTRSDHKLVVTGPYRWVRHPFYTGMAVLVLGKSLLMANWFILVAGGAGWLAFIVPRSKIEERNLVERFGDDYGAMTARTGRFLPRWQERSHTALRPRGPS